LNILDVRNLTCEFLTADGPVYALNGVDLTVEKGEIHGLVGESGCGKSVTSRAVMGLLDKKRAVVDGSVKFFATNSTKKDTNEEVELIGLDDKTFRDIRGRRIAMVFQDPQNSLSPLSTVGFQIEEAISNHLTMDKAARKQRVKELLARVGLPASIAGRYPFELSGGMQQRVMIAMAVSCEPELLIADEPTTALDVTIQAQVLALLKELRGSLNLSVLFITHNLAVVAETCDNVSVMYGGRVVESAPVRELLHSPAHPYSKALLECVPRIKKTSNLTNHTNRNQDKLSVIPGFPPRLSEKPIGCTFAPRCKYAQDDCKLPLEKTELSKGRVVYCKHPLI
jgi:peptide/nickel transport system ATP-binding protein